jgi:hypothetical protein
MGWLNKMKNDKINAIILSDGEVYSSENARALAIISGEEYYSPRQWLKDVADAVGCTCEDEEKRRQHTDMHRFVLLFGALYFNSRTVKHAFFKRYFGFIETKKSRKIATDLIKEIRKEFKKEEELLAAIMLHKVSEFEENGLPEDKAVKLACEWLFDEVGSI